jgi:adhesin transport system outer membrane protein
VGKVALLNLRRLVGETANSMELALPSGLQVPAVSDVAKETARSRNHDLLASAEEIKAIQLEYEAQRGRFEPRAEIEVSASKTRNISGSAAVSRDAKVMLIVTVPLLNGGTDLAQMRAATARMREQQARTANVERKLAQELDASYANLDSFDTRYSAALDELRSNAAVVKAFREQLTGANRTLLDVLDAYQRFHQSKLDLLQLTVVDAQTQFRVAHLTGSLLDILSAREPGVR